MLRVHLSVLLVSIWLQCGVPHALGSQILSRMPEVKGDDRVPLGISLQNCKDPGVHIKDVYVGTPANRCRDENSGEIIRLEIGDHVLAVNDETVSDYQDVIDKVKASPDELHLQVSDKRTGKIRYLVTLLRGVSEPLEEEQAAIVNAVEIERLGISCHQCTEGIHVDAVTEGGPATQLTDSDGTELALQAGDHILSLNGKTLRSMQSLEQVVAEAPASCSIRVKTQVDGAIQELSVQLEGE